MYVYILYLNHEPTIFKIGSTTNIKKRLSTLQTGTYSKIVCHTILDVSKTRYTHKQVERFLHQHFAKYKVRGEWFRIPLDILQIPLEYGKPILNAMIAKKDKLVSEKKQVCASLHEHFLQYSDVISCTDKLT